MGESTGQNDYMAHVNMLRMVRILDQYRHASVLAMKLKLKERFPLNNNEVANPTLYELYEIIDQGPDSFDTQATREIRSQIPN